MSSIKKWAAGLMTVPSRRGTLLLPSLASVRAAGFDNAGMCSLRLFVDGVTPSVAQSYQDEFKLPVTSRPPPPLRPFGNWCLALAELLIREPVCDFYAMFQDDIACVRNLRQYLERQKYPTDGYWNPYTMEQNLKIAPHNGTGIPLRGWFPSYQCGWGALCLVFDRETLVQLFSSRSMIERPMHASRGWRNIDGAVVNSLAKVNRKELVHYPSLIQHLGGDCTTIASRRYPPVPSYPGNDFDALSLLQTESAAG